MASFGIVAHIIEKILDILKRKCTLFLRCADAQLILCAMMMLCGFYVFYIRKSVTLFPYFIPEQCNHRAFGMLKF